MQIAEIKTSVVILRSNGAAFDRLLRANGGGTDADVLAAMRGPRARDVAHAFAVTGAHVALGASLFGLVSNAAALPRLERDDVEAAVVGLGVRVDERKPLDKRITDIIDAQLRLFAVQGDTMLGPMASLEDFIVQRVLHGSELQHLGMPTARQVRLYFDAVVTR